MKRYIDADGLVQKINAYVITTQDVEYIKKLINETEPADVAPVIHAHWETTKLTSKWIFVCSHCHDGWYERYEDDNIIWKYCPDCGAKMDEEVE